MKRINIHGARTHFSQYIDKVEQGEAVVVCRRNQPVAEIRPIAAPHHKPRPIGLAKGKFTVPASFFEELPSETIAAFQGEES